MEKALKQKAIAWMSCNCSRWIHVSDEHTFSLDRGLPVKVKGQQAMIFVFDTSVS